MVDDKEAHQVLSFVGLAATAEPHTGCSASAAGAPVVQQSRRSIVRVRVYGA